MEFKVIKLKRAELELEETYFYYKNIQENLGKAFILDYENRLNTLYDFPFFEVKYNVIRILPLKKFPYSIHFTIDEITKTVFIQAITCDYQDPKTTKLKL